MLSFRHLEFLYEFNHLIQTYEDDKCKHEDKYLVEQLKWFLQCVGTPEL